MTQLTTEHGKWRGEIRRNTRLVAATRVCDTREQAERLLRELITWLEDREQ